MRSRPQAVPEISGIACATIDEKWVMSTFLNRKAIMAAERKNLSQAGITIFLFDDAIYGNSFDTPILWYKKVSAVGYCLMYTQINWPYKSDILKNFSIPVSAHTWPSSVAPSKLGMSHCKEQSTKVIKSVYSLLA